MGGLFGREETPESPAPPPDRESGAPEARGLGVYLDVMHRLIGGDAVGQANAFADVADAVEVAPTTTNRLKYALALALPGHAGADASAAERELTALLAGNTLLPEERMLAEIHLAGVTRRLVLDASAERLRRELADVREDQDTSAAAQLQAALDENRRLREELRVATEKLEAITSIEQSIREREDDPALP